MADPRIVEIVELVPVGAYIFLKTDTHPAELFPNTAWKPIKNDLYITSDTPQQLDPDTNEPTSSYTRCYVWLRLI